MLDGWTYTCLTWDIGGMEWCGVWGLKFEEFGFELGPLEWNGPHAFLFLWFGNCPGLLARMAKLPVILKLQIDLNCLERSNSSWVHLGTLGGWGRSHEWQRSPQRLDLTCM